MKLKDLIDVYGSGNCLHVGTESGHGWLWTGCTADAAHALRSFCHREIINIYQHEGRKKTPACCGLLPGLGVVIAGCENGRY